jgi:hypothetical protein
LRFAGVGEGVGVCTDTMIDDSLDLPARLPSKPRH